MTAQPKGGMCLNCQSKAANCSHLPFATMPVIARWGTVAIVRCSYYIACRS